MIPLLVTAGGILLGGIVGTGIGSANSNDALILTQLPQNYDFSILKPLARYPGIEPEYLDEKNDRGN